MPLFFIKLSMEVKLSLAAYHQAVEICGLVNSVYRGENAKKGWTTEADFIEGIRITDEKIKKIIETNNNVIINALVNDKIIGCVPLEKKSGSPLVGLSQFELN